MTAPARADVESGGVPALLYLASHTSRNRLVARARRLRDPRYAAAIGVGLLYLWFALLRPNRGGAHETANALLGERGELVATLGALVVALSAWVTNNKGTALAFSQAEVHFLFPAPLSRRLLIGYKIYRSQVVILLNALIWIFILRRGNGDLPAVMRFLGVWALFANTSLHRFGAALVRASWLEHGRAALRRQRLATVISVAVALVLVTTLVRVAPQIAAARGLGTVMDAIADAFSTPAALAVLWPVRVALGPAFAHTTSEWWHAFPLALALVLVQGWWVVRTDAAFEESAVQASIERARRLDAMRARRGMATGDASSASQSGAGGRLTVRRKTLGRAIPLPARGNPSVAIVWKNMLCLLRTGQLTSVVGLILIAVVAATALEERLTLLLVAMLWLILAGLLLLMGSRLLRNDLRQDMLNLELLKLLPLDGVWLVMAEVASSTIPLAAAQFVLVALAYVALLFVPREPLGSLAVRTAVLAVSPALLLALDGAALTIQNGTAVLFPSWVRLGAHTPGGIEMMGQGLLTTGAWLILLGLSLLPPAAGLAAIIVAMNGSALGVAAGGLVAAAILGGEVWLAAARLGKVFERTEPTAVPSE